MSEAAEQPTLSAAEIEEMLRVDIPIQGFLNAYNRLANRCERMQKEAEEKDAENARLRKQLEQAQGRATVKVDKDEIELDEDDEI